MIRWLPVVLAVTALLAGLVGVVAGMFLFPRTLTVEKPVEVVVEKRVEVPVEKPVIVEKRVELPAPPFSYEPESGGKVAVSPDDLRIALRMRDAIRKAGDEPKIAYDADAIFLPTKSIKVLLTPNPAAANELNAFAIRKVVVAAFEGKGFKVLADDANDGEWNTLVHVEIDAVALSPRGLAGRVSVSLRQGMLGYSNTVWRKVNLPVVAFSDTRHFGADPSVAVLTIVKTQSERAATELAAKLAR